jgi:hypothetical protein
MALSGRSSRRLRCSLGNCGPNLTPTGTRPRGLDRREIVRAIREGVSTGGRSSGMMNYGQFRTDGRDDLAVIATFVPS